MGERSCTRDIGKEGFKKDSLKSGRSVVCCSLLSTRSTPKANCSLRVWISLRGMKRHSSVARGSGKRRAARSIVPALKMSKTACSHQCHSAFCRQ